MTAHVVMFSGGIGSWATAKRVAQNVGADRTTLLFADTKVEDADTYRFLHEAAENVGSELVIVEDGRTPFEVFHDDRFLGNARLANCSKFLKQKPCRDWLDTNSGPETTVYVGIDWSEVHRLPAIVKGWAPYPVKAPLCSRPLRTKDEMVAWAKAEYLKPPEAYEKGYPHANCLAQGCVRGGQAYWRLILRDRPDVYANTERLEQELREHLSANVAMLRDRRGGEVTPLTLEGFREQIELAPSLFDADEWGGCGCFTDDPTTPLDDLLGEAA
jgi:hypothetical protein